MLVVLAGATGALGSRIAHHLAAGGAEVRALVRAGISPEKRREVEQPGIRVSEVDFADGRALAGACEGADIVVSALSGLRDVVVDLQKQLLDAAVAAGVPRFMPSDFAIDFTKLVPGQNRNLDLRRDFMVLAERAPITLNSVLNGAFADMLTGQIPIVRPELRRVLYWGDADQLLDFTTMDDAAAVAAAVALQADAPRFTRVAGDQVSAKGLARVMGELTGKRFGILKAGPVGMLPPLARFIRRVAPAPGELYPAWQGVQYMHGMFGGTGKLAPLDNDRFPWIRWTTAREVLSRRYAHGARHASAA